MRKGFSAAFVAVAVIFALGAAQADTPNPSPTIGPSIGTDSNLPVPRYVSLRTQDANGRHGPGLEHPVDWIYQRVGLPLQVTGESGPWRRVVDPDGAVVWIHAQNLDARRMAYVREAVTLRRNARADGRELAHLDPGVVGALTGCDGDWRRIAIGGRVGWVEASALWGAECEGL